MLENIISYFKAIDTNLILKELLYNKSLPMFGTGFFFYFFIFVLWLHAFLSKKKTIRIAFLSIISLYFFYKTVWYFAFVLIITACIDYFLATIIHQSNNQRQKKIYVSLSIIYNLLVLIFFKYTLFISDSIFNVFNIRLQVKSIDPLFIIGISYYTFQSMAYTIDVYRSTIKPLRGFLDYVFYLSFFPKLLQGPIVKSFDFLPQIHKKFSLSQEKFGKALFLIAIGLIKKIVISDYISVNFVSRIFDNPSLYSGFECIMAVYGYAIQFYCDFSGYSDMAIGLALLLGFELPRNFRSPYQAISITDFWRRWHISFSTWLKEYLYISLGGNRKGKIITYFNLFITMLLGGIWHGSTILFVIWGALHGVVLIIEKITQQYNPIKFSNYRLGRFLLWLITFHIVCFGWLFFASANMNIITSLLDQIIHKSDLSFDFIKQFIIGYKYVIVLMLMGYSLHFLPDQWQYKLEQWMGKTSFFVKFSLFLTVILLVLFTKSSDIQPFIYFKF